MVRKDRVVITDKAISKGANIENVISNPMEGNTGFKILNWSWG